MMAPGHAAWSQGMLKLIATLCLALTPFAVGAEIEKYATLCNQSICFHWWPRVPAIPGWHHDEEQSQRLGANVWVPDGSSFSDADAIIYAEASYKPRTPDIHSLAALIDKDRQFFQQKASDTVIAEADALKTADGQSLRSLTFFARSSSQWERVSYGEEGEFYLIFTLSAHDKASYERRLPLYKDWLASYKEGK
jgi:hypothetical protein